MVTIKKKFLFFSITEKWFEYRFSVSDLFFPVIYKDVIKLDQKFYFGLRHYDHTAELDLKEPIESISSRFRATVRAEIRKIEREGIECFFNDDIDMFIEFYNDFAASKKLEAINKKRIVEMGDSIKFSYASLNGVVLAAHSYLEDREIGFVRGLHSASVRLNENYDHHQIGRANKFLTYRDMIFFKERGIGTFDFGSNEIGERSKKLLEFKQALGGTETTRIYFMNYSFYLVQKIQKIGHSLKKLLRG